MSGAQPKPKYGDLTLYRRLLAEVRPLRSHLVGVTLLGVLAAPLALLLPIPLQVVVDSVLSDKPLSPIVASVIPTQWADDRSTLLLVCVAAIVLIGLLVQIRGAVFDVYSAWIGSRLVLRMRQRLFDQLQRLSLAYHNHASAVDGLYRVQVDAWCIESILDAVVPIMRMLLQVALVLLVAANLDQTLMWIALAGAPVIVICVELFRRRLRRQWEQAQMSDADALTVVGESMSAIRLVKAFGLEDERSARFAQQAEQAADANVAATRAQGLFSLVVGFVSSLGAALVLYIGSRHVLDGQLTLGEFLLLLSYLSQLYRPIRQLGAQAAGAQRALASAARVFEVLDDDRIVRESPSAQPLERANGAFSIQGLTFGYGRGTSVLRSVDLEIPAGSRVGIAGRTGSGKSTLLSLLPRLYDPQEGTVRLDGVDVRDYRVADLRRQFAIVLQDDVLFTGSVRDNIAVGRAEAGDDEIRGAAEQAAAHDFIAALPQGYSTSVGEGGHALSGGERQRISLARAFLRDAPILILDEPTSALDADTEASVLGALDRLMAGRTTFIIAHRMNSLVNSDIRLVVRNGAVSQGEELGDVVLG